MNQLRYFFEKSILFCLMLIVCVPHLQAQKAAHQAAAQGDPISRSDVMIFREEGKFGLKRRSSGAVVLPAVYDDLTKVGAVKGVVYKPYDYGEQLFLVQDGDKFGVFNSRGEQRLPVIYDQINSSFVVFEGKKGIINLDGKVILPFEYDKIQSIRRGAIVEKDGLFGLVSKSGAPILEAKYKKLECPFMSNYLYITNQKGRIWVLDMDTMKYVSNVAFDEVEIVKLYEAKCDVSFREEKEYIAFQVTKAGKIGYLKADGSTLLPIEFESIQPIVSCRAVEAFILNKDSQLALADAQGKVVTLHKVEQLRYLQKGLFAYTQKGKEGLLNTKGEQLTKAKYDYISYFGNITTRVELGGKQGKIDTNGAIVKPIEQPIQRNGYTSLDALFNGFTDAIKSNDEAQIRAFAQAICIDQQSIEFMYPLQLSYRGIPNRMLSKGVTVDKISSDYFERMMRLSNQFKLMNTLNSLEYLGQEREGTAMHDARYNVQATETFIKIQTNERVKRVKLGELLLIDGVWKVFTTPKF